MLEKLIDERMVLELRAATKKEALMELAEVVHAQVPQVSSEKIYKILWERESLGSTGIGEGIAIPHGKLKELGEIVICFGRSREGVSYDAVDGKPVHLLFLLLAPQSAAGIYLSSLAQLSRFLKSSSMRTRLMNAETKEEFQEIFREVEWV